MGSGVGVGSVTVTGGGVSVTTDAEGTGVISALLLAKIRKISRIVSAISRTRNSANRGKSFFMRVTSQL